MSSRPPGENAWLHFLTEEMDELRRGELLTSLFVLSGQTAATTGGGWVCLFV